MCISTQTAYRQQAGLSLIEIFVSLFIGVLLTGLSVPSYTSFIASNRVSTQTHAVMESLFLARNYAVSTGTNVHVCQLDSTTGETCSDDRGYNSDWSHGWLIFSDTNRNTDLDEQDTVLRIVPAAAMVNTVFNQRGRLRFFPDGSARSAGFYLCDQDHKFFRHVYLLHSGRARINDELSDRQKQICKDL